MTDRTPNPADFSLNSFLAYLLLWVIAYGVTLLALVGLMLLLSLPLVKGLVAVVVATYAVMLCV